LWETVVSLPRRSIVPAILLALGRSVKKAQIGHLETVRDGPQETLVCPDFEVDSQQASATRKISNVRIETNGTAGQAGILIFTTRCRAVTCLGSLPWQGHGDEFGMQPANASFSILKEKDVSKHAEGNG
jgi:hypothetical protein